MNRSRAYWTLAPPARCSPSPASPAPPKGHDSTKVNRRGRRLGRRAAPWARGGATAWALARAKSRYHGEVIRCRGASLQADPPALQPPTPPPYNTSLVLWPRHTATAYPSLLAHRALEAFFVATGQTDTPRNGPIGFSCSTRFCPASALMRPVAGALPLAAGDSPPRAPRAPEAARAAGAARIGAGGGEKRRGLAPQPTIKGQQGAETTPLRGAPPRARARNACLWALRLCFRRPAAHPAPGAPGAPWPPRQGAPLIPHAPIQTERKKPTFAPAARAPILESPLGAYQARMPVHLSRSTPAGAAIRRARPSKLRALKPPDSRRNARASPRRGVRAFGRRCRALFRAPSRVSARIVVVGL